MPKVVREYKEQARSRIVAAAGEVLRRKGLGGTTMEEIAREIGVSKGALYLYFPSKARVFEAVLTQQRNGMMKRFEHLFEGGDVAQGIVDAIGAIFSSEFGPAAWHEVVAASADDPEIRAVLRRDEKEDNRQLKAILGRLEKHGRIPPITDPDVVTDILTLLIGGSLVQVSTRGDAATQKRKLVRALRYVLGLPLRPRT